MNRAHPNFGLKTKIGEREWWRRLIRGEFPVIEIMSRCVTPEPLGDLISPHAFSELNSV